MVRTRISPKPDFPEINALFITKDTLNFYPSAKHNFGFYLVPVSSETLPPCYLVKGEEAEKRYDNQYEVSKSDARDGGSSQGHAANV